MLSTGMIPLKLNRTRWPQPRSMPVMTPTRILSMIAILTLASCAPSRPMPVVIEVADATSGQPVQGVIIHASGGTFYVPTMQPTTIGAPGAAFGPPPDPPAAIGETNEQGMSRMIVAGQRPVFLRFFKEGYAEGHLVIETGEWEILGATTWTTGNTIPPIDRSLPLGSSESSNSELMYRVSADETSTAIQN